MLREAIVRWQARSRRSDHRTGPDFLFVGCQKAGSSWLYDQLAAHPDFWMPPVKELHYFDGYDSGAGMATLARRAQSRRKTRSWASLRRSRGSAGFLAQVAAGDGGKLDLDWYGSLFQWKDDRLSGDITPAYCTLSAGTIARIATHFADLRYIFLVRDPVARAWSHAWENRRHAGDPVPRDWPEMERFLTRKKVAARSYPSRIFARWREHVPAERIFVGLFDQLASEPDVLRDDVLRFLDANPLPTAIEPGFDRKRNHVRAPCPPEMQRRLAEWFSDELEACARVFGGPAAHWPHRYSLA
jgi:hypothetical protein